MFQAYFLRNIYLQVKEDFEHFKSSFDTYLNFVVYGLNLDVLSIMVYDFAKGDIILENPLFKAYYAVSCFMMWIKLYCMMRMFSDYAHFVTVIFEVIRAIKVFSAMLIILMLAFSNFFYVIGG